MSRETLSRTGNIVRRSRMIVALGLASLIGAGCGSAGRDPSSISFCSPNEAKGRVATTGTHDENDYQTILDYAEKNKYGDKTATEGISGALDKINGLGEIVCQVRDDKGEVTLHFLPSIERIRQRYLTELSTVQQELGITTTTTIG